MGLEELAKLYRDAEKKMSEDYIESLSLIQQAMNLDNKLIFDSSIRMRNLKLSNGVSGLVELNGRRVSINWNKMFIGGIFNYEVNLIIIPEKPTAAGIFEECHHALQCALVRDINNSKVRMEVLTAYWVCRLFPESAEKKKEEIAFSYNVNLSPFLEEKEETIKAYELFINQDFLI